MGSSQKIKQSSQIVEERLKQTIQEVVLDFERGYVKSKSSYHYLKRSALREFFSSLDKPLFAAGTINKVSDVEEYNRMIKDIYKDISVVYAEVSEMNEIIDTSFEKSKLDKKSLQYRIKGLESKVKEMSKVTGDTPDEIVFHETFMKKDSLDVERVEDTPLKIWSQEGILTLAPTNEKSHTGEATIQITGGNGFPGNTKEVHSVDGELLFKGEDNLRVSPAEIIDGVADTWMEYENLYVNEEERRKTSHIGYTYEEGVEWVSKTDEKLKLQLTLRLEEARIMNWISISPFLPAGQENLPSQVLSLKLHDGKGRVTEIIKEDKKLREDMVILFDKCMVKEITILLEQPTGYDTSVGHFYYREKTKVRESYFHRNPTSLGRRVEGPSPSIVNIGAEFDRETNMVSYPVVSAEDADTKILDAKNKLFYPVVDKVTTNMISGTESVKARRKVIGLREVELSTYEFAESGAYVSREHLSPHRIESVSIDVEEEYVGDGNTSVKYYISPNDGNDWYRIKPRKSSGVGGKPLYIFNSRMPKEGQIELFGYIDIEEEVKAIRVKIEVTRGVNEIHRTPIIKGYKLNVLTRKVGTE